ncbi:MAG: hypothetical protein GWN00_22905 [Aliifodinibius sp.]|nr:hypothetical protein [Fodinibius sp.]NIY27550.1 hypothetical protein [Fodinibius sp.]
MELEHCAVCEAEFKPGYLNGEPCEVCKKLFPGAKTKEDKHKNKKPEVEKHEVDVKKIVEETLINYGILIACECGNYFYRKSPAQKQCSECKNKETK